MEAAPRRSTKRPVLYHHNRSPSGATFASPRIVLAMTGTWVRSVVHTPTRTAISVAVRLLLQGLLATVEGTGPRRFRGGSEQRGQTSSSGSSTTELDE